MDVNYIAPFSFEKRMLLSTIAVGFSNWQLQFALIIVYAAVACSMTIVWPDELSETKSWFILVC